MPRYDARGESFLAGLGGGVQPGLQLLMKRIQADQDFERNRQARMDELSQVSRSRFASEEAGERAGSASQRQDVMDFLSAPEAEQEQARALMTLLSSPTDQPVSQPQGGQLGATGMRFPPEPINPTINDLLQRGGGMGIPQTATPLRQLQTANLLPRRGKEFAPPRPPGPSRSGGGRTPNFTMEANRALDTVRDTMGTRGRLAIMTPEQIVTAGELLEETLKRQLTDQELDTLKKLGSQRRTQGVQG